MQKILYFLIEEVNVISIIVLSIFRLGALRNNKIIQIAMEMSVIVINIIYILSSTDGVLFKILSFLYIALSIGDIYNVLRKKSEVTFNVHGQKASVDANKLFEHSMQGAKNGEPDAMYNLASYYSCGCGTSVNFSKARKWANKLINYPDEFWSQQGVEILAQVKQTEKEYHKNLSKAVLENIKDEMKPF